MKRFAAALTLGFSLGLVSGCRCMDDDEREVVALCQECGMETASSGCCDPSAIRCEECGMIKGSPGCCR